MSSESLLKQLKQSFYSVEKDANGNITKVTPNERLDRYCTQEVQKISIDGNEFTGYKTYSFFWEKTYVKEPERSAGGVIDNLNSIATFITPHLQINFSLMSIEDYRRLYKLIISRNEFVVTCYDVLTNETTTNKMYFYPDSLPKLNMLARQITNPYGVKEKWIELLGVQDYTIEMVGTNAKLGDLTVTYAANVPSGAPMIAGVTINVANGQEILIGKGAESIMKARFNLNGDDYIFEKWSTVSTPTVGDSSVNYAQGQNLFVSNNITLYAQWIPTDIYTLSFDYGLGQPQLNDLNEPIYNKQIKPTDTFGTLHVSPTPKVKFFEQETEPYERKGWYRTPQIGFTVDEAGNKVEVAPLKADDTYKTKGNSTIYQIFKPLPYTITFNSKGGDEVSAITADYDSTVALPIPTKEGATFKGWYYDEKFEKPFGGKMPPVNSTLYAKWE